MLIVARLLLILSIAAAFCAGGGSAGIAHEASARATMAERMAHAGHHMTPEGGVCDMSIAHCATALPPGQTVQGFEPAPCPIRHPSASTELAELAAPDLETPPPRS
ncbi:MAG: hypothetical protein VYD87_06390 [Pseudomonadota bacterium]|nr:hypothetical protein [Pseudomonadota bacterium]